jgi:PAS domain-containing protein
MNPHLNTTQVMLLFGGAILVFSALALGIHLLQKSFSSTSKPGESKLEKVRVKDEAAFTLATVKSVITQLKDEQKTMQEKLAAAERRADENARKFELLAREFGRPLLIFDAQGFIAFSNPLVRKVLAVDTWSRRRYAEIFRDTPALSQLIRGCFETGMEIRKETIELQGSDGKQRRIEVSALPTHDRIGAMDFVVCTFREVAPPGRNN